MSQQKIKSYARNADDRRQAVDIESARNAMSKCQKQKQTAQKNERKNYNNNNKSSGIQVPKKHAQETENRAEPGFYDRPPKTASLCGSKQSESWHPVRPKCWQVSGSDASGFYSARELRTDGHAGRQMLCINININLYFYFYLESQDTPPNAWQTPKIQKIHTASFSDRATAVCVCVCVCQKVWITHTHTRLQCVLFI